MKNLKILFPAGSFYPAQNGGPDNTVYWITKAIQRKGHLPIIATTDLGQPLSTPRGRWLDTDYGQAIYTRNLVHYFPTKLIRRAIERIKEVDMVHLAMIFYPGTFLLAVLNSKLYRKPMLWSSHGDLDPPMLKRSQKKKATVLAMINRLVDKDLLWFHSTCDAETKYIRDNFGEDSRIIQIPNYMELPERIETSKERYFLYIGRIDPKKAVENLVEALALSQDFMASDFTLKVVGDYYNDYGRMLVNLVASKGLEHKIRFLGHREGREKQELLAAATFTFMPSHTENFGIVVMEGLAQGTPAVASTGTPWAILEERSAGYWVDNDAATLAETVDRILSLDAKELERMNENALQLAREEFSIHANVSAWEDAYQKIATWNQP